MEAEAPPDGEKKQKLDTRFAERMDLGLVQAGIEAGRSVGVPEIIERTGLKARSVFRYFKGRRPETWELVAQLAQAMFVDPGWLAFGEASKAPRPQSASTKGYDGEEIR